MGSREMCLPMMDLAEARGIRDAIGADSTGYGPYGFCAYVCSMRATHKRPDGSTPLGPVGSLYCCVYGEKEIVYGLTGTELECVLGFEKYTSYFDDIDETLVDEAAAERPEVVADAFQRMERMLKRIVQKNKYHDEEEEDCIRASCIEKRPRIAKFLLLHGPARLEEFCHAGQWPFYVKREEILYLAKTGFLACDGEGDEAVYRLSDSAPDMLSAYEPIEVPEDSNGKTLLLLSERGEMTTRKLSDIINVHPDIVRKMLRGLMDAGLVKARGRGSSRRYCLAVTSGIPESSSQ